MGRRREKHTGKRKTVLQLDEPVKLDAGFGFQSHTGSSSKTNTGAANPLSALVGQYADSEEESDYNEYSPANEMPGGKRIDSEVANFLAEIDAISGPDGESSNHSADLQHTRDVKTSQEEAPKDLPESEPTELEAPTTVWQHCLDEGTQHYYYWNTDTNQVTWEIPEEYQQYLLLLKQYEEALALREARLAAQKDQIEEVAKETSLIDGEQMDSGESEDDKPIHNLNTDLDGKPFQDDNSNETDSKKLEAEDLAKYDLLVEGPSLPEKNNEPTKPSVGPDLVKGHDIKQDEINKAQVEEEENDQPPLDPPTFTHFEYVNKKYEPDNSEIAGDTFSAQNQPLYPQDGMGVNGSDDIDQELEQALEKKKDELKAVHNLDSAVVGSPGKRPLEETEQTAESKKPKLSKVLVQCKAMVADISSLITNKLAFLEVTTKGLSKLQVLLIEMQTRVDDWRNGALETSYLMEKLQEADSQLKQFEQSAAPSGWSCHWDRTYSRYFYTNAKTQESQWDYPDTEVKDEVPQQATASVEVSHPQQTSQLQPVAQPHPGLQPQAVHQPQTIPQHQSVPFPASTVESDSSDTSDSDDSDSDDSDTSDDEIGNQSLVGSALARLRASYFQQFQNDPYNPPPLPAEPAPPGPESPPPPPPPPPTDVTALAFAPPPPPPDSPPPNSSSPPPPPPGVTPPPPPEDDNMDVDDDESTGTISGPSVVLQAPPVIIAKPPITAPAHAIAPSSSDFYPYASDGHKAAVAMMSAGTMYDTGTVQIKDAKIKKKEKKAKIPKSISLKKKNMPSLVHKWQQIQHEVAQKQQEEEEEADNIRLKAQRRIDEWKKLQLESGMAADNPNFMPVPQDWREKAKQLRAQRGDQ